MIYDCFLYAGESDVLDIRLNELADVVDQFVIVEATHDLQGNDRSVDYYMPTTRRVNWRRITHVVIDEPLPRDPMTAETYMRNQVMRGLTLAELDDLVICSDVDEIPRASIVLGAAQNWLDMAASFRSGAVCWRFGLREFYYKLDWEVPIQVRWKLSFITTMRTLQEFAPGHIRQQEGAVMPDAGWHFSCLDSHDGLDLQRKLCTFSHAELNTKEITDILRLNECIRTGTDLLIPPRFTCNPVDIDETYPQYVRDSPERFAHLMRAR